eukprot:gene3516-21847_t
MMFALVAIVCAAGGPPFEVARRGNGTMLPGVPLASACNSGCIPEHVKLKEGKPDCCTKGHETLKCPRPAHYQCGPAPSPAPMYGCSNGQCIADSNGVPLNSLTYGHMKSLAAYLQRIALASTPKADLATLALVMAAQSRAIPFENYDVVMKKTISMARSDIEDKLVSKARGGYCWEQNTLLQMALESIGFTVTPLMCRVRWNKPDDTAEHTTAYTHMALKVETEAGPHLADRSTAEPQSLPEGTFRIADGTHPQYNVLQLQIKGEWKPLYEWRDERAALVDQECSNWFSCTYPTARFTSSFFTCRIIGKERHHILNSEYVVRSGHGAEATTVTTKVTDKAMLLGLIKDVFGVTLEETEGIDRFLVPRIQSVESVGTLLRQVHLRQRLIPPQLPVARTRISQKLRGS